MLHIFLGLEPMGPSHEGTRIQALNIIKSPQPLRGVGLVSDSHSPRMCCLGNHISRVQYMASTEQLPETPYRVSNNDWVHTVRSIYLIIHEEQLRIIQRICIDHQGNYESFIGHVVIKEVVTIHSWWPTNQIINSSVSYSWISDSLLGYQLWWQGT